MKNSVEFTFQFNRGVILSLTGNLYLNEDTRLHEHSSSCELLLVLSALG